MPHFDRRTLLAAGACFSALPKTALALSRAAGRGDLLWYRQPASRWEEAMPIGNGRLGCMVFGRIRHERLQLNEDTLWAGSPYDPDNPEAAFALSEVRRLLADGEYHAAEDLAAVKMMGRPLAQMSYGTLGDLLLDFAPSGAPVDYERSLDLASAITHVRYRTPLGRVRREAFVSAPDHLIVVRFEGPRGTLDLDLSYAAPGALPRPAPKFAGPATDVTVAPAVDWTFRETIDPAKGSAQTSRLAPDTWLITGRNEPAGSVPAGLRFAAAVKVVTDGTVEVRDDRVLLRGGTHATLLVAGATSYISRLDVSGDPVLRVRQQVAAGAAKSYARLRRDHVKAHRALFDTMTIDLGRTDAAGLPTDQRVLAAEKGTDPALAALYVQYARYLLISSSRPGSQPANLQGIWNDSVAPPWGSKYTVNINAQMNYWIADPANLGACFEPLLRMVEELSIAGARTARSMYRARGWVAHHNTDLWRATAPVDGPQWGLWPLGGAWLCTTLWDHWDYSREDAFLERLYPLMRGAALFFLDTLVPDPQGRGLITSPSLSPENQHPFGAALCAGPAMDRQILRDLFDRTIDAGRRLGQDGALLDQFGSARRNLAPDRVGELGQLQEWLEDWDAAAPEQQHRHVSHLYAVYPSEQINVRDTPVMIRAAEVSLDRRGDRSTGWATAWRLCLWARMGRADRAHAILLGLLGPERTYPNLFDAHPPFQIDGNFGGATGILEMLVQSWGGELILLPALPKAWPAGSVKGVRARGGLTVDLQWSGGKVRSLGVRGAPGSSFVLRERDTVAQVTLGATGRYSRTG
jgi:alpha-L-fucosidase 2